jgi:RNA polymerase sigma-70 factor (ECF subfamily)
VDVKPGHCTAQERDRLLQLALSGEQEALNRLLEYHMPRLYLTALRILGTRQDAEDALQDGLLAAVSHLKDFKQRSQFSTWLTRIVINSALIKLRPGRRQPMMSIDQEPDGDACLANEVIDLRPNPEQMYIQAERFYILQRKLQGLPALGCSALRLRLFEGMSIQHAADLLGVPQATFKSALYRARVTIRDARQDFG